MFKDSIKATEQFLKKFSPDQLAEFKLFYNDITVIFFPDRNNIREMLKQVKVLADEIRDGTNKNSQIRMKSNQLLDKNDLRKYFSSAVSKVNKTFLDSNAVFTFNFSEVPLKSFRTSTESTFLILFFQKCMSKYGYKNTKDIFLDRIKDIVLLSLIRIGVRSLPENKLPIQYVDILNETEGTIRNYCIPCSSTSQFYCSKKNDFIKVNCINSKELHVCHMSHETYFSVKESSFFAWLFYGGSELACRWAGNYEMRSDDDISLLAPFQSDDWKETLHAGNDAVIAKHLEVLSAFNDVSLELSKDCTYCLGCFFQIPTEKLLPCDHIVCVSCCELAINTNTCPICLEGCAIHELQEKAGYRILSLDGGGVRGIMELIVLSKVEEVLGLAILDLFDFVIGTSTGGILALTLSMTNKANASDCIDLAKQCIRAAFGSTCILPAWYLGYKYETSNFFEFLYSQFGDKKLLFGCNKNVKVAVTSCVADSTLTEVLFTSYDRKIIKTLVQHKVYDPPKRFSVVDVALATSAAPTYLPIVEAEGITFVDGGLRHNCPAEIGLQECQRLWPEKSCDFLLSVGTGTYKKNNIKIDNTFSLKFVKVITDLVTNSEDIWNRVRASIDDKNKCFRINPELKSEIKLDDKDKIEELINTTNEYLNSNIDDVYFVSARLFSCLFYVDEVIDALEYITFTIKSKICINEESSKNLLKTFIFKATKLDYTLSIPAETFDVENDGWIDNKYEKTYKIKVFRDRPFSLSCKACVVIQNHIFETPISGSPFIIHSRTG
jgi:hypothetical protein